MFKIFTLMLFVFNFIRGYFMKFDGEVTTGLGKAAYFLSQDFYKMDLKKIWDLFPILEP